MVKKITNNIALIDYTINKEDRQIFLQSILIKSGYLFKTLICNDYYGVKWLLLNDNCKCYYSVDEIITNSPFKVIIHCLGLLFSDE